MKNLITRLCYGLLFAIPLMLVNFAIALLSEKPQATSSETLECKECHQAFVNAWETGGHGQATSDPVFVKDWESKGKPDECLACHVTGFDPTTGTWQSDGIR